MKNLIYLFGPTLMIFIGLHYYESILMTFILFYSWLFLIPFNFYFNHKLRRKSFFKSIKKGFQSPYVIIGIVSGAICLIAIFSSVIFLQNYSFDISQLSQKLDQWGFSGTKVWGFIFVLLFINPFLEEWYWREFIFMRFLNSLGNLQTIFLTSFFYAVYHLLPLIPLFEWPFGFFATIPIFFAGLLWGYFRIKFGSMIAAYISHSLADLGIILVYLYYFM